MDGYERASTRRELLRLGVAAGVAAVWAPRGVLWQATRALYDALGGAKAS